MPNRGAGGVSYRYGFNGKETENDVKGIGNEQDYGMRIYDPRLGRFLSFDPLNKEYNDLSPFHFAGCNPIQNIDQDGGEPRDFMENWIPVPFSVNGGKPVFSRNVRDPQLGYIDVEAFYDKWSKQTWFVHRGDNGRNYYWKHNPGADQTIRIAGNGKWEEFKTQNRIQYENTIKLADNIAIFFSAAAAAPFLSAGVLKLGSAALSVVEPVIVDASARIVLYGYRYYLMAGTFGMKMIEWLDETGSVSSSSSRSLFLRMDLDEQMVVKTLVESGRKVEILEPSKIEKVADIIVDGIATEIKTITAKQFNANTAVTKLTEAFQQGKNVILNLRQYDLTEAQVKEIVNRAKGSLGGALPGQVEVWTQNGKYKF